MEVAPGWGWLVEYQARKPDVHFTTFASRETPDIRVSAWRTFSIVSSSVDVPAVRPTTRHPRKHVSSRSAANCTWNAGTPRSRHRAASSRVLFEFLPPTTT